MIDDATGRTQLRQFLLLPCALAWTLLLVPNHTMSSMDMRASQPRMTAWALMLLAMMPPLLIAPIRHIQLRSFTRRRPRSIALFLLGYTAVWTLASAILLLPCLVSHPAPLWIPAAALALTWHGSPARQTCLNRCHALPPLAAFGTQADRAALHFGLTHGLWCGASCCTWMLLPMLLPAGQLPAMILVSVLILAERLEPAKPPRWELRLPRSALNALKARLATWLTARSPATPSVQQPHP